MGYHSQLQPARKYKNERSIYYVSHIHWILSIVLPNMNRRLENSKILFIIKNAFGIFRPHSKAGCSLIHIVEWPLIVPALILRTEEGRAGGTWKVGKEETRNHILILPLSSSSSWPNFSVSSESPPEPAPSFGCRRTKTAWTSPQGKVFQYNLI